MGRQTSPDLGKTGYRYRELTGALTQLRNDIRDTKPQPEIVVVIDGLSDVQKATLAELIGNPKLEFKITAADTPNGLDIFLHVRNKVDPVVAYNMTKPEGAPTAVVGLPIPE